MKTLSLIQTFSDADFAAVELTDQTHSRIKIKPMYFQSGLSPHPQIFARRAVLNGLIKALDLLPEKYGFLVWDVYRPRAVQARLFEWMREEIRKRSPELSDQQNFDEARKYAALPSKVGEEYCPPHLSGGAIDLTLLDLNTEKEIAMGTEFDDCTERAHSFYFDGKEKNISGNRKLLRDVMCESGFVPYQYEWWHFDMGDMLWSKITGNPAVFGPLFGDAEWN